MKHLLAAILSLIALNNAYADGHGSAGGKSGKTGTTRIISISENFETVCMGHGTSGRSAIDRAGKDIARSGHGSSG